MESVEKNLYSNLEQLIDEENMKNLDPHDTNIYNLYYREATRLPLLTKEEETKLAYRAKNNDLEARNKLVEHNLRYVISLARDYVRKHKFYNIEFLELINEGNVGLMIAIERFDPDLGYRLSTYSRQWIELYIARYIYKNSPLAVSEGVFFKIIKFTQAVSELKQRTRRNYSSKELSEIFNIQHETVVDYLRFSDSFLSLNQPIGEDEEDELGDLVEDENSINPEDYAIKMVIAQELRSIVETLPEMEQNIIKLHYGLDKEPLTLQEIGDIYNVSRQRISQIENKALEKLRLPNYAKRLK